MVMRIIAAEGKGAQIYEAEKAEKAEADAVKAEAESKRLMEGINMSVGMAIRLATYAVTIIVALMAAAAIGAAFALLIAMIKRLREAARRRASEAALATKR